MKRFSQLMPAGVPVEFDYPARSFTLLGCITPVDVRFGTGSQTQEVAEGMTPGLWYEAETPFRKVVITSPVDQVVSFLVSMGRSGWSAAPCSAKTEFLLLDNLPASATINSTDVFIGDDWPNCSVSAQFDRGLASAGGSLSIQSDDVSPMVKPRLCAKLTTAAYVGITGTNHHLVGFIPTGPYVRASFINGATIQPVGVRVILNVMRNVSA